MYSMYICTLYRKTMNFFFFFLLPSTNFHPSGDNIIPIENVCLELPSAIWIWATQL